MHLNLHLNLQGHNLEIIASVSHYSDSDGFEWITKVIPDNDIDTEFVCSHSGCPGMYKQIWQC
jgi:hypothetical protein